MSRIFPLLAATLVAGCAAYDGFTLRPGVANEGEVRRVMGTPALEMPNPDGSRQLAYPRGPLGTQTFMVDVGRDGILKAIRPVLNEENYHRITPGQTREEVLRLVGPPGQTMDFPNLGQVAWDYRYQDAWGYVAIFSIMIDREGKVAGKVNRRLDRGWRF